MHRQRDRELETDMRREIWIQRGVGTEIVRQRDKDRDGGRCW